MMKLGEKIWRLREGRGLSQEALAEMLEVSRQTISNWENDKATPDAYKLKQLCDILGVSVDGLWETGEGDIASEEKRPESPEEDAGFIGRKEDKGRVGKILLLSVLGAISALLLAVAVVLFTMPQEETLTSAVTLTPTMAGVFLLVFAAALLVAVTILLFKRK